VGGPLSGALFLLDGAGGVAGWQWIFLGEGLPSVLLGIVVLCTLPNRPEDARWLSPAERACLAARIRTRAAHVATLRTNSVREALLHPMVWRLSLLLFPMLVGLYTISFWLPQLVQGFTGLGNVEVAVVSAIPYVTAAVAMVIVGSHSDRTGERCLHIA